MYFYFTDFPDDQSKDTRLTFHPEHELPQMRLWYNRYKNPSDTKLNFFASELNKGHVRQERTKVTVAKLKNWWKNERQREKRISMREDTEEKEQKEIQKLKAEAVKSSARQRFIEQDHEKIKIAKIVPSPQRPVETRSGSDLETVSRSEQLDPSLNRSPQQISRQNPTVPSIFPRTVSSVHRPENISYSTDIITDVDQLNSNPRGFISLLQQSSVGYENRSTGQRLAESGPGTRITNTDFQIRSPGDSSEIRSYGVVTGQVRPGIVTEQTQEIPRPLFGEGTSETSQYHRTEWQ